MIEVGMERETNAPDEQNAPNLRAAGLERAEGVASVRIRCDEGGTSRLANLRQSGAAKCFLPKIHDPTPLAVLVNTAGGLAGGDRFTAEADVEEGAALSVTTQAAERVYRAVDDKPAQLRNRVNMGPGATLNWLPQETILFDGGRLERQLEVHMAEDSNLLAMEMITLGRRAMGETVSDGFLGDQWRIHRAGRLVFADALRLTGPINALLAPMAAGDGARSMATLLYVAPDAEERLDATRAALEDATKAETARADAQDAEMLDLGASAWDKLMVIRMVAGDPAPLRRTLATLVEHFRGTPPPKFWSL